jgi:mono/diheme cytochrome c family protein
MCGNLDVTPTLRSRLRGAASILAGLVFAVVAGLSAAALADDTAAFPRDEQGFHAIVEPFLHAHCMECHGPEAQEADLRVDVDLTTDFLALANKARWEEVVNVLNSHEMPPEEKPRPPEEQVARVVDWITSQMVRAELHRRDSAIVMRRLNRHEYQNTIRDLLGVDVDVSGFPQDPPAGGFDNNGQALSVSPLLMELYLDTARKILDRALVEGDQPPALRWRFQPESGNGDDNRVTYDGQRVIVHGSQCRIDGDYKVMHHQSWDRHLNARDFALPHAGEYIIRIRAAGTIPDRAAVVASARKFHERRLEERMREKPDGERWYREEMERDLAHFEAHRMYGYGPPRLKLVQNLGGQPRVIAEFDVPASLDDPQVYEVRARFTTEKAGLTIEYAYDLPKEIENFWMQGHDEFARPELWVDWFEIEGPVYDAWPPSPHTRLLGNRLPSRAGERAAAREVLSRFMREAYRRHVTNDEIEAKLVLFDAVRAESESYVQAIKTPLIAVLSSPHFLYLTEGRGSTPVATAADERHTPRRLSDHELAARLSYFLWSSMPDEELNSLADSGRLSDAATLRTQVDRMLADPKSRALVENFTGQWLGLRDVGANPPAEDLYPQYDRHLELSMIGEGESFFAEILRHDLSVLNFVRSEFVVINERLARYYGIDGVRGDNFRRVAITPDSHRGGVVTQAAVLTITSNGTRTSPVKRGTWVLKNLLGIDPGLPVANAGEIAPQVPGIDRATVRQRLEVHRTLAQCARCHNKIDPLGFALENFNAAGAWRDQEGFGYKGRVNRDDPFIDASATMPDGTEFVGVAGLQASLMEQEELFLGCLSAKLLTYALGRELGVADQVHVQAAVRQLQSDDDTLRSLIQFIVQSEPFQTK